MALTNLNTLSVDSSGRASFSGLSSGIDFQKVVTDLIAAKRIPIDSIETRIATNTDKITAIETLRGLLAGARDTLSKLRGTISLGKASDAFAATQVFASTSRFDGSAPSAAGNLLGASSTNAAAIGSHNIEVLRTAAAQKVASATFGSQSTAIGTAGTFEISGSGGTATVTVQASDTLQDIRDRINNANTGTTGTKVTASIVQASTTQFVLVLTADQTGTEFTVTDTGSVLSDLGISSTHGAGGFRNGLADPASKVDATADGFSKILFDGTQGNAAFLISYNQATKEVTLTRGDGVTDTATLSGTAIASGATETATFSTFGATIVLDSNFDKSADIVVDADVASVTGGTGAIDSNTVTIAGSAGDISAITSTTLTFGNLVDATNISVTVGGFSGTFDGSGAGAKTVTLTDGNGNSLTVDFTVTTLFDGNETAASIDLQELENLVVSSGIRFTNQIQTAQTARFTADGLLDPDRFESEFLTSATSSLTAAGGSFNINVGAGTVLVNYVNGDTLTTLVTKINDAITLAGGGNAVFDAGTTASIFADGAGSRLVITNTSTAAISLTDTNGLLGSLGVDNNLVIERSSNTISDLFSGITLSLFQAEEGTSIKLDVDRNLTAAKTSIQNFVTAYNDLKIFLNQQNLIDPTTGKPTADTGALFGSPTILGVDTRLSSSFSQSTQGVDDAFSVLRQIGITLLDKQSVTDPLEVSTLKIDDSILDEALLNNSADVRRLFAFDFASSDPRVSLLNFTGKTTYDGAGYKLNINFDDRYQSQTFTDGGAVSTTAPMEDYLAVIDGSFEIRDSANVLLGTVAYSQTDSLQDLAAAISASVPNVSASIITSGSTFKIEILHSSREVLTFTNDTGGVISALNLANAGDGVFSANINGSASGNNDGTATVNGRTITATNVTTADGLKVFYSGGVDLGDVQIDHTVGLGARLYASVDDMLAPLTGLIDSNVSTLTAQNEQNQKRVDDMTLRLERTRAQLLQQFINLESALARAKTLQDSITQTFDALFQKRN